MKIVWSSHARMRMRQFRQRGITYKDVEEAAKTFPGKVPRSGYRIMNCMAKSGRKFELPIADEGNKRKVITVVGVPR